MYIIAASKGYDVHLNFAI